VIEQVTEIRLLCCAWCVDNITAIHVKQYLRLALWPL
jgi:hypothetical protein